MLAVMVGGVTLAAAQETSAKQVEISWDLGPEHDIKGYQLFAGDSDTTLQPVGELIEVNPLDPEAPPRMATNYELEAPAGSTVVKWFSVAAVDTSNNQSALATPVSITIDSEPPATPTGLTVKVVVVVNVVN
jgi:hypothetical protein